MDPNLRNLFYLLAAILFVMGIKGLAHPRTAVRGNLMGACGMLIAVVVTLIDVQIIGWPWILAGLAIGAVIGVVVAIRIPMTAMPELVAAFNGFGGLASFLVAAAELHRLAQPGVFDELAQADRNTVMLAIGASGLIGAVTTAGSAVAVVKLLEKKWIEKLKFPGQLFFNGGFAVAAAGFAAVMLVEGPVEWLYWAVVIIGLMLGVTLTTRIGGADMPVVVALLNSYSGLAAAATGFVISNNVLIISGSLVGASGLILTKIMCVAMNRSLTNVLFGVMADAEDAPTADEVYEGKVKSASADEVAMMFDSARKVLIVPGYGMAVAQAQHAVRDLGNLLEERGVHVDYGIHPVAGRMPGHMNVLLAEADVPYDKLQEMDAVNAEMDQVDVAIVIGANDTVNPAARLDPTSPIAGMPIIDVDRARTVVVIKRSLSPGFAGIPNPLFAADNCLMLFGDGKKMMLDLATAVKES